MPSRPPEKYEPGELDRTRQKLGELTPEESRRMMEKLGGEIGVEKSAVQVEKKYAQMKSSKADNTLVTGSTTWKGESRVSDTGGKTAKPAPKKLLVMKYFDRVRSDFLCASTEYRIKTFSQAVTSIFTFGPTARDFVSRHYILDTDHKLIKGVENLVLSLRGLTSKNFKYALQNIRRIPLYNEVIRVLRNWDVDALSRELGYLQKNTAHCTVKALVPLLKPLLRPIFLLSKLSLHLHIQPAITKMYELVRMYLVETKERERVLKYYVVAREEIQLVFTGLKFKIYPLLLKLLATRFITKDEFFSAMEKEILDFLSIEDKELIKEVFETSGSAVDSILLGEDDSEALPAEAEEEPPKDAIEPPSPLALKGLELTDALFARAGFRNLDTNPDLYSYFQTVFEFPRGTDLIDPRDPLQPVIILSVILQNLLYGFQNMRFGTSKNQFGATEYLQDPLERAISQWHFFMEEAFGKIYLDELQDYCRSIERSSKASKDSRKSEAQLYWYKKNYFLPHLRVPILENVRIKPLGYSDLGTQIRQLLEILAPIAVEVEQNLKKQTTTLMNPQALIKFQINNSASIRLQSLLKKVWGPGGPEEGEHDGRTNRNLLYFSIAILSALHHLVNEPNSLLYVKDEGVLYRTSGDLRDEAPLYNVPRKNTMTFLKKMEERELLNQAHKKNLFREDSLTDIYGPFIVNEELKTQMIRFHREQQPFCILSFRLQGVEKKHFTFRSRCQAVLKAHLENEKAPEQTLMPQPDGTILLVLPGASEEFAEELARKILESAALIRPQPVPLMGLVIPFQKNWDKEKLLAMPTRGYLQGREFPAQVLGIYQEPNDFTFREDLPIVHVSLSLDEGLEEIEEQLEEL